MRRLAGTGGAVAASGGTGGRAPAFARRRPGLFRAAACLVLAATALLVLPAGVSTQAQNEVRSTWALTPSGLAEGDQFRLIFVTSTERTGNATSSDIEVYNTFVQARAAAGHSAIQAYSSQFRVVGSTRAVDARDNTYTTGTGVPIYWLNGRKVANNYADFYDGSWSNEANPKSELGTNLNLGFLPLFTGSADDGTESFDTGGGSAAFGRESVRAGRLNHATANPLSGGLSNGSNGGRFYALSPVFTVKSGPAIDDVSVTSRPADGTDTFKAGERIEVTFTFDEAVEVQNAGSNGANVSIRISMGDTNTYVTWSTNFLRMDPPRKLVFGLTVNSSHEDDDGLCISASCGADTIRLSGGGAIVAAEDGVAASRNYDAVQTSWNVDGDTEGLTGGVCDRQPAVRDAIVAKVSAASTCAGVTDAQVNAIGSLDLSGEGIGALRKSDLQGLTGLTELNLSGNALDHLPGDLFEHLDASLRTLKLNGNPLGALPAGVFDGLTGIRTLDLADTGLTELPAGLFADLDSLQELRLVENRLRAFPSAALADVAGTLQRLFMRDNDIASIAAGALDGMTQLRRLELQGNALTSLPAGLFDDLTELRELKLNDNSIATLPDNLLRPLTKVEVVSLEGNPGFDSFAPVVEAIPAQSVERGARVGLEAVLGASPWGDNVTWSWTQTDSSGTTVTLDDADTTTPSFDAPSPNDETALAFEATAKGRGTSGAGASEGTRTARVTVPGRASIVDVSVTSRPLDGGTTFKLGDRIEITATFSEPVRISAQRKSLVEVNMTFGARQLFVDYHRQDHPNRLIFRRVVESSDNSNGALWLGNGDLQNGPIRGTMRLDGNASVTARSDSTNVRRGFEARQTEWRVNGNGAAPTGGICGDGYHPAVLRAIVRAVPLAADCSEITSADLAQIASLDVSGEDVDSLHKRDFEGLTGLLTLDLSGNALDHLPSNLFDQLTTLTELKLNGNDIAALPANVFNRLTALTELELHGNDIAVLPGNVFNLLTSLQALDLRANELTTLPPGVFDRLTELRRLRFSNNNLGTLPDNVFEPLTKLISGGLWLSTNPGFGTFAPVVTVAVPAQTVTPGERVDLEATAGPNPWGANLQWSWSQTDTSGVTVTLVDGNTRSAHFVAPAPVLETELGFQATATGRGTAGVGSPSRGTADAAVTVEDTTPPELVSAEVGGSGDRLTLTFNEDLDIEQFRVPPASAFTVKADGVEVTVQSVVGSSLDTLGLTLSATIGARQIVTVSYAVPATGTVIADVAGNDALSFTDRPVTNNSTLANTTPPVLESAGVLSVGDRLTLTFNEFLDITETKLPPASAFTVKADGVEVTVQSVVGSSLDTLGLKLSAAIGQNQIVTVSYAVPTTGTVIADTDGNRALAFDDEPVINNSTVFVMDATGTPTISGVPQVGNALRADTSDIEDDDGLPAAFTYEWVRVAPGGLGTPVGTNSSSYTVSSADVGSTIRVDVSFIDGAGNPEGPLPSDAVPAVAAAGTCPAGSDWRATLTMGYSFGDAGSIRLHNFGFNPGGTFGALDPATIPYGTGFTVTQIARLLTTSLDGNTITLDTLSFTVSGGDLPDGTVLNLGATALTVGTDSHSSTAGREQWNLRTLGLSPTWVGGQEMTVCANLAPVLESAKANGTSLVLTYTEDLDTGSTPAASAYSVTVDGGAGPAVSNVSVSGDKVTLTLAAAVTGGQAVTLQYSPGSNPVQDESGLDAPGFADRTVAVNNDAVGEPTISGMPQVGQMLTADVSAIRDTDGLPSGFDYRWVRVATDSTETDIGTNSSRYSPTYSDVGSTIRVEVSFTDGAGNAEGPLASVATAAVAAPTLGTCPADSDWRATMTMGFGSAETAARRLHVFGFRSSTSFGALDPATITYGSTEVTVTEIFRSLTTSLDGNTIHADDLDFTVTGGDLPDGTVLNLGATALTVGTHSHTSTAGQERWNLKDLGLSPTWVEDQELTVCANLPPGLESAKADGTSLVLTYTEDLDTGSVPAPGAYSVTVAGGAGPAVSSVSVSGTTVTLTLAAAVTAGPALTVTYTPGSNPVQDGSGLDALPLTGQEVGIEDTTPPIPASAEVPASGDTLNLTFNEDLDIGPGKLPPASAFTVTADGVAVTVQAVAASLSDTLALSLSSTIKQGQTVTVDYKVPATNPIQDTDDNNAMGFTDFAVDNNSTVEGTPPIPASGEVPATGNKLTLTFNEDLDIAVDKLPPASAFTVKADGVAVTVQDVALGTDLDNFVLNLPDEAINQCQTVTVDYEVPATNPIQDTDDNDAVGFTGFAVDNNSMVECPNLYSPVFEEDMLELEVAENVPLGTDIGEPVTATDADRDTVTYSLDTTTPYASYFQINPATGQLQTNVATGRVFNHEKSIHVYAISVIADDGREGTDTAQITVVVSVTDVDEPPDAPVAVTVTGSGTTSLEVTWTAPSNVGRPDIEHYDVQYREAGASQWTDGPQDVTVTSATIMSVDAGKSYEVQVRATNDEGDGPWAVWGADNSPATGKPAIGGTPQVGQTLTAGMGTIADTDGLPTTSFPDGYGFQWVRVATGGAETNVGTAGSSTYSPTSADVDSTIVVKVSFPDLAGFSETVTSDAVGPVVAAEPQACVLGGDVWCATLTVQNLSGGRGCANSQSGNRCTNTSTLTEDEFRHDGTDYDVTSISVASNGDLKLWLAPDPTAPTRTLVLVVDGERFALANSEGETSGSRTGRRWDSSGLSWSTGDTVELRLVEGFQPLAPAAPGVNGVGDSDASLKVTWSEPNNAGRPPITHYDLRYRVVGTGINGWQDGPQGETGPNATIGSLMVDTRYDVQVRASNADGDGPWSPSGQGTTGVVEPEETRPKGSLRLVDENGVDVTKTTGIGRLEVLYGNKKKGERKWGTVCDDRFDQPFVDYSADHPDPANKEKVANIAATLACRWSGAGNEGAMVTRKSLGMSVAPDSQDIWLDDVRCAEGSTHWRGENSGTPTALHHCYNAGVSLHNCKHKEDVHLQCTGTLEPESAAQEEAAPLTGQVEATPATHDGETPFTFRLVLSEDIANGDVDVRDSAFEVTGGSVTGASRVDGRSDLWEITVTPDGTGNIAIVLAANRACGTAGALCTADGRMLTTAWLGSVTAQPGTGTATTSADEEGAAPLTAQFVDVPAEHDGESKFRFRLVFSEEIFEGTEPFDKNKAVRNALDITGGAAKESRRVDKTEFDEYWIDVRPSGNGPVTISLSPASSCSTSSVTCTPDGRKLSAAISARVEGPPGLSVADAEVQEGPGAALAFAVTLDRSTSAAVQVDYATRDGSAQAGSDYTASSGTLSFAPGETAKTVTVAVLDDSHDEGSETLTLVLSNPSGAYIEDGEATGTIENSDLMPQAWLSRFGRTVAEQVLDAVEERIRSAPQAGVQVTVAGQRIGAAAAPSEEEAREAEAQARLEDFSTWLRGAACRDDPSAGGDCPARTRSREVTPRDLLTGTSFALTTGADGIGGGLVSLWGRGALTRFDGREGDLSLSGEVTGTLLGADWTRERWTTGLMLSHARGEGSYRGADSGKVSSTVTGLYPYGRYALSDRVTVWGAAGYGAGTLTLTPEDGEALKTDMDLAMAAAGLRGVVFEAPPEGGPELAVKTDAMAVRTSSEATGGGAGGNLAAAEADVTRLRLGLEGTWRGLEIGTGTLVPRLELGVRHDGGDAETGFGLDLGGGLAWSDPGTGLRAEVSGRGLLTHESAGFRDLGFSGALAWDPTPGSDRGPSLTLSQTMGLSAQGGADALLGRTTLAGLAANDNGDELENRRLELNLGYGFPAFGDRFTSTPEVGFGMSEGHRDYSLAWRFVRDRRRGDIGSLEFSLETRRRESANDDTPPEHTVGLRLTARFVRDRRRGDIGSLEFSLETRWRESANDDTPPEHTVGLRLTARF